MNSCDETMMYVNDELYINYTEEKRNRKKKHFLMKFDAKRYKLFCSFFLQVLLHNLF